MNKNPRLENLKPFKKGFDENRNLDGAVSQFSKSVKETVLNVFNDLQKDHKHNLEAFARKYPRDFYNIAAKLIPTDIRADLRITKTILEIVRESTTPSFDPTPAAAEGN